MIVTITAIPVNKSELSEDVQEYFKQFDDFNNVDIDTTNSK